MSDIAITIFEVCLIKRNEYYYSKVDLFRTLNNLLVVRGCVYHEACAPGLLNAAGH